MTRRLAGALVAGVLLVLTAPSPVAGAQQAPDPVVTTASRLAAPIGRQPAQLRQNEPNRLRVDIGQLTPRVVTSETNHVVVAGRLTNTGDRRISAISVRLQRGEPLKSEAKLREALTGTPQAENANSNFVSLGTALDPGASTDFALDVPLRGGPGSLRVDQAGVYPLLVNVNGTLDGSKPARLAALSMLLPVLSVPGGPAAVAPTGPAKVTMLWPLVDDRPRLLRAAADGTPTMLTDDGLAESLATGGRLFSLLNAVDEASLTGQGSNALSSLCFAVDPDLLTTVEAMTGNYVVRGADGGVTPGTGTDAAKKWLDRLRTVVKDQCVLALPYADADLAALSRAGATDLEDIAAGSAEIVRQVLKPAQPLRDVVWPIGGTLDERTLTGLSANATTTVLADAGRLQSVKGSAPLALGANAETAEPAAGHGERIVPIDELVSSSLEDHPSDDTTTPASVQNGLATLVFRVAFQNQPGQSVLVAPPRRWTAPAGELDVFLQTLGGLYSAGLASPQPLSETVSATAGGTAGSLDYTSEDAAREVSAAVLASVGNVDAGKRDLLGAMEVDNATLVDPKSLVEPLQNGLLRAVSGAWRHNDAGSATLIADVANQLDLLREKVTVVPSALPFSLTSENSSLPVQISNGLPVAVKVHIAIGENSGLRLPPGGIPDQHIPAQSAITRSIPVEVIRSGKFTVDIGLTTPGGAMSLGDSARFELSSTSYGTITLAVTGTAAAALVLLVGRRIYRRVKAGRAGTGEQGSAED